MGVARGFVGIRRVSAGCIGRVDGDAWVRGDLASRGLGIDAGDAIRTVAMLRMDVCM